MTESATSNGWARTLTAADEMEADLRADGWEVVTVRAAHVAPEPPSSGDDDRYGFVYVAQGSDGDALAEAVDVGTFADYAVFNRRSGSDLYAITRITDDERELVVLLVGAVDLTGTEELVAAAREHGRMYSHVQLLDGTRVATFEHDDVTPFFGEEK